MGKKKPVIGIVCGVVAALGGIALWREHQTKRDLNATFGLDNPDDCPDFVEGTNNTDLSEEDLSRERRYAQVLGEISEKTRAFSKSLLEKPTGRYYRMDGSHIDYETSSEDEQLSDTEPESDDYESYESDLWSDDDDLDEDYLPDGCVTGENDDYYEFADDPDSEDDSDESLSELTDDDVRAFESMFESKSDKVD